MVSFICNACGQTVKKNRVEKHYQTECPNCSVLSCIDCGKDFHGDAYAEHTSCISEAEKYQGKLYQPKENANKGEVKQQEWIKKVQETGDGIRNPKLKGYLNRIQEYSNVPRKKAKFINFCRNSLKLHDPCTLEQLWEVFDPQKEPKENGESRVKDDSVISNGHSTMSNKKDDEAPNLKMKESLKGEKNDNKKSREQKINDSGILNGHKNVSIENNGGTSNLDIQRSYTGEEDNAKRSKKRKMKNQNIEEEVNCKENNNENGKCKKKRKISSEHMNDDGESDSKLAIKEIGEKFSWQKTIKTLLKGAGDDGIQLKKLQKKAITQYFAHGPNHKATTKDECAALFKQKLSGYRKARISKERVFYFKK